MATTPAVAQDLPSWCRIEHHAYLGRETLPDGRDRHLIERGSLGVPRGRRETGMHLEPRKDRLSAADVLAAVPFPEAADPGSGFAPRGARVEPGGPVYPFTINRRDLAAPPEVAQLYDQAVVSQWDAGVDIPWSRIGQLPPPLEAAVGQIMTFLAENELSALYVPSRFLARVHPAFVETAMFLATQLADEARHIDAFLKRARTGGGGVGISAAITSRSLHSLLEPNDFLEATFLLSVLGEGTFLDLLRFIEDHAPDPATAELCRRARVDETRHVHFGLAHTRHALSADPTVATRLEAAVRRRAATLHEAGGVPAPILDALTILAAGGTAPAEVARGHEAVRALLHTMHESRLKRLQHAGFTAEQAELFSALHTPNFM
jgi:hypothetical protein